MKWGIECMWQSGATSWVRVPCVSDPDDRLAFNSKADADAWLKRTRDLGKYGGTTMKPKELS